MTPKLECFYYTNKKYANLVARQKEIEDNVIPSSNSEMATSLFRLGLYFDNQEYTGMARQMMVNVQKDIHQNIRYYSNWASLELKHVQKPFEVAIVGADAEFIRKTMQSNYLPNTIFLGGVDEGSLPLLEGKLISGKTKIYVCQNKICQKPTIHPDKAMEQLMIR